MSDHYDFEFLNETDKLAKLNTTSIQYKLTDLLLKPTPDPADIQCVNCIYPSNSFCQAYLESVVATQYNTTYVNASLPCVNITPTDDLLKITQSFLPFASQAAEMIVRCNLKACNSNKNVLETYALIRNEFTFQNIECSK